MSTDTGQKIIMVLIVTYFLYYLYYYVAPMYYFRALMFFARRKNLCFDYILGDGKITLKYLKNGQVNLITRAVDEDVSDRYLTASACHTLRVMLSEIRKDLSGRKE